MTAYWGMAAPQKWEAKYHVLPHYKNDELKLKNLPKEVVSILTDYGQRTSLQLTGTAGIVKLISIRRSKATDWCFIFVHNDRFWLTF
jgi:hypothetical protein